MADRAAIFGLLGPDLSDSERGFFAEVRPWGFILFARNVATPEQLRRLTGDLRDSVGWDAPVLIDQEGGRVARMRGPLWQEWGPVRDIGDGIDDELGVMEALRLRYQAIGLELRDVGIDVNCVPLLDVPQRNAHPIIGDRALGWTPEQVAMRGREAMAGLMDGGVLPVIKHLPGHGRALHDSHEDLPRVPASMAELRNTDFPPFLAMRDAVMGMTAHVVYEAIDAALPATLSPVAIQMIRQHLGFDGLLMTDDLSMRALDGPMDRRTKMALLAGCDVVLHCNGDMLEMMMISNALPELEGDARRRAERVIAARRDPVDADMATIRARYNDLTREADHARRLA